MVNKDEYIIACNNIVACMLARCFFLFLLLFYRIYMYVCFLFVAATSW